jgi:uncharacterized protein (AIM24 family)
VFINNLFVIQSFCLNTFSGPGDVAFGFDLPGDILPFATSEKDGWIVTRQSFICGTTNLRVCYVIHIIHIISYCYASSSPLVLLSALFNVVKWGE